jgi:hypothetical protein
VDRREPPGRLIVWLLGATVACYGIGYPVALLGHSVVGWILVFLGGPCLLALGALTVRRIHRSDAAPPQPGEVRDGPPG